ncbi:hypothetical protein TI39_contig5831g00016 [Zymoseptoria brevis]|uniref:Uncharacterized protein n=1 Tax=Zymoseptoria brevis TaxID=1047168 RepID=A0A0F4G5V8_9PEZI|nr:hypothetical protein TI39_contig5831g00016 [Zymoseptoria brevis]
MSDEFCYSSAFKKQLLIAPHYLQECLEDDDDSDDVFNNDTDNDGNSDSDSGFKGNFAEKNTANDDVTAQGTRDTDNGSFSDDDEEDTRDTRLMEPLLVVSEAACSHDSAKTMAWARQLKSSVHWAHALVAYIPPQAKSTFSGPTLPSTTTLQSLPFLRKQAGTYMDVLSASPKTSGRPFINIGMTTGPQRRGEYDHSRPKKAEKCPNNKYYQAKHKSTPPVSSHFVSLVGIPANDTGLPLDQQNERRMLARFGEVVFTIWTGAIDNKHPLAQNLHKLATPVHRKLYRKFNPEWDGFATHSPLKETLGLLTVSGHLHTPAKAATTAPASTATSGTRFFNPPITPPVLLSTSRAASRSQELADSYALAFGGRNKIPQKYLNRALTIKERRAPFMRKERERTHRARLAKRTEIKNRLGGVKGLFERGKLSREDYEYAKAHEGHTPPREKTDERTRMRGRRTAARRNLKSGKWSREEFDRCKANDWRTGRQNRVAVNYPEFDEGKKDKMRRKQRRIRCDRALKAGTMTKEQHNVCKASDYFRTPQEGKKSGAKSA